MRYYSTSKGYFYKEYKNKKKIRISKVEYDRNQDNLKKNNKNLKRGNKKLKGGNSLSSENNIKEFNNNLLENNNKPLASPPPNITIEQRDRAWLIVSNNNTQNVSMTNLIRFFVREKRNNNPDVLAILARAGLMACNNLRDYTTGNPNCGNIFSYAITHVGYAPPTQMYPKRYFDNLIAYFNSN